MFSIRKYFENTLHYNFFKNIYCLIDALWTSLIMASIIMFFFIQAFKIPSGSMRNTLLEGDHLFVNKFIYGFHIPFTNNGRRYLSLRNVSRGDIVVFQCPPEALTISERGSGIKKDFIKRCVAVADDVVEIRDKKLFVNGINVNEEYVVLNDTEIIKSPNLFKDKNKYQKTWETGKFTIFNISVRDNFGPISIPKGYYMMMGDNRDFSSDSRFWGPVADKYIKGRALFIYWPINRLRIIR
jgi:signal peptidase I